VLRGVEGQPNSRVRLHAGRLSACGDIFAQERDPSSLQPLAGGDPAASQGSARSQLPGLHVIRSGWLIAKQRGQPAARRVPPARRLGGRAAAALGQEPLASVEQHCDRPLSFAGMPVDAGTDMPRPTDVVRWKRRWKPRFFRTRRPRRHISSRRCLLRHAGSTRRACPDAPARQPLSSRRGTAARMLHSRRFS